VEAVVVDFGRGRVELLVRIAVEKAGERRDDMILAIPGDGGEDGDALSGLAVGAFDQREIATAAGAADGIEIGARAFEKGHGTTAF
jgi:hypothetical protein